jgi:hypothetical protein
MVQPAQHERNGSKRHQQVGGGGHRATLRDREQNGNGFQPQREMLLRNLR